LRRLWNEFIVGVEYEPKDRSVWGMWQKWETAMYAKSSRQQMLD